MIDNAFCASVQMVWDCEMSSLIYYLYTYLKMGLFIEMHLNLYRIAVFNGIKRVSLQTLHNKRQQYIFDRNLFFYPPFCPVNNIIPRNHDPHNICMEFPKLCST